LRLLLLRRLMPLLLIVGHLAAWHLLTTK